MKKDTQIILSVIIPFYEGNAYVCRLIKNIRRAAEGLDVANMEVIIVNDSPWEKIIIDKKKIGCKNVRIIKNHSNIGIHKSRCKGLKKAVGKYVIFFDQDDELEERAFVSQIDCIEKRRCDLVIANGYFETDNGRKVLYENCLSQRMISRKSPFLWNRNLIFSPGQCIIRKEAIPCYWTNNIVKQNGSDDYYLWLLIYNNKRLKVRCNYDKIYIHKYTGCNVSSSEEALFKSNMEVVSLLRGNDEYRKRDLKILTKTLIFKQKYKKHLLRYILKDPLIFAYNVLFTIIWRGFRK